MSRSADLTGCRILVTRPAARAATLCDLLEQTGADVVRYPVLVTRPVSDPAPLRTAMARADIAVFVSVSAVDALGYQRHEVTPARLSSRPDLHIAAVGDATAAALEFIGFQVAFQPGDGVGSEGLLRAMEGLDLRGLDVVIFAAERGRPLLAEALTGQGARVLPVLAYHRAVNHDLPPALLEAFVFGERRLAVLTSVEGTRVLLETSPPSLRPTLLATDLVVVSDRIAAACRSLGFGGRIGVTDSVSDQAIVAAVCALAAE